MRRIFTLGLMAGCSSEPTEPTYYADIQPILEKNCMRCHAEGSVGPSFEDPQMVVAFATAMKSATEEGRMPPPAPDPECAPYLDSEKFVLSEADRATIARWADAGAPLGDPEDAPTPSTGDEQAPPDRRLEPASPWPPAFVDNNAYHCWAFDLANAADVYATRFQALVDQAPQVHHIVLYLDESGTASTEPGGFSCDGLGESDWTYLHGWAPGSSSLELPLGTGIQLPPNARLAIGVHYFDNGAAVPDRSGYGIDLVDQVNTPIYPIPLGAYNFTLEAGDAEATVSMDEVWEWGTVSILGVWPHMHQLGTGFDMRIAHPDGTETCVVRMDGYDFHNQVPAYFLDPIMANTGDRLQLTCSYDNSADNPNQTSDPPIDVRFGEETQDEMCFGFTYGALGAL
jgi:hypothetical protein